MIGIRITGTNRLRATFTAKLEAVADLSTPMTRIGIVARDAAVRRIKMQGDPAWPPTLRGGHIGIDTGRMWQSIGVSQTSPNNVIVGTNVTYARYFQEGTGIYAGHSTWKVTAQNVRALHFRVGGEDVFARSVTMHGQRPRPFLYIDEPIRTRAVEILSRWLGFRGTPPKAA